jgi:uncharacterized integral membrane protein
MRAFSWLLRLFLFGFLLAFALLNAEPVSLHFFFEKTWEVPLVALLLAFFAAGMLVGVLAMAGPFWRARREAGVLRKKNAANGKEAQVRGGKAETGDGQAGVLASSGGKQGTIDGI